MLKNIAFPSFRLRAIYVPNFKWHLSLFYYKFSWSYFNDVDLTYLFYKLYNAIRNPGIP